MLTDEEILASAGSVEDVRLREKAMIQADPFALIDEGYLSIKTKEGTLSKLYPNRTQIASLDLIRLQRRLRIPCRLWQLKARQQGISTVDEAAIYCLTSQKSNVTAMIMADTEKRAINIASMLRLYHDCLSKTHPHLIPTLIKSNTEVLKFSNNSIIHIETAGNINAGRSYTPQYVHLSEVAYFPDFNAVMTGLVPAIPDFWDTLVMGETTGNGMNMFFDEWKRAVDDKTDWIAHFTPCHFSEEYHKSLIDGKLYSLSGVSLEGSQGIVAFEEEEDVLRKEHGLSEEKINWRRWKISNGFQGDVRKFKQEYPYSWKEAFVMSGDNYFEFGMDKQKGKAPLDVGDLFYNGHKMKYEFRPSTLGAIQVLSFPNESGDYIVTGDPCEGGKGDEAAGLVLNKITNRVDAVVYGQMDPERLGEILIGLGNWYNNAMIAPENNGGYGDSLCKAIYKNYANIYKEKKLNKKGVWENTGKLGFNTNLLTRPAMLSMMRNEIKEGFTELISRQLISECETFIKKYDKANKVHRIEGAGGKEDGLVICRAIAGYIRTVHYPYDHKKKTSHSNSLMYSRSKRSIGLASRKG